MISSGYQPPSAKVATQPYRLIDEDFLLDCWRTIRKNAAHGVDGISARQYEENLIGNIRKLVERLKRKNYRARLVRRHWIPKLDGKKRPLGIPVVEDKLLQLAVTRILGAIYEQDFLRCSYGYRPNKGALDAVDKLTVKLQFGRYNVLVEADIQGFFNNLDHDNLIEMLSRRIGDRQLLRLIRKWLKAGVLDTDGKPHLKRRTSRKKLRNSLANFTQWCKENRSTPLRKLFPALNPKLRGYYQYYGVSGNSAGLHEFYHEAMAILWKWLNRRSQRRSFTRQGFTDLLDHNRAYRRFHSPEARRGGEYF